MSKIQFTLKVKRPVVIYTSDGKSYCLKAGDNHFDLDYSDYVSLTKLLGVKSLPEHKLSINSKKVDDTSNHVEEPTADNNYVEQQSRNEDISDSGLPTEQNDLDEHISGVSVEDTVAEDNSKSESTVSDDNKEVDYSSMTYAELKAEYKNVTGKSCKLKKEEIIQFLQEHKDA